MTMTTMKMPQLRSLQAKRVRLLVTACLSLVWLCRFNEVSGQQQPSSSALIYKQREFADDVLRSLYNDDNECSSMLGLSMVFGLLYPSAVGDSLAEMQQVFGFPSTESNLKLLWSDTQNSLEETLNGNCSRAEFQNQQMVCLEGEPLLEIANIVWVPRLDGLNETYKGVVGNLVREMDFSNENAGRRVNRWVNDATNGLIRQIVNDGPMLDIVLLAVNTIYLKAQWAKPFLPSYTNNDQFYTTASRSTSQDSTAHFMHQVDFFDYSEMALSGYQLLKMPFSQQTQSQLSMVFALPLNDEGGMIIPSTELVWDALPQLARTRMALAMPKFNFISRYGGNLKGTLQNLGLNAPFSKGDLCIQNGSCDEPRISKILQKTVINLNEEGVEAAAASAVFGAISLPTEQPVLFQADHPFYFFILDESAGVVIFEGRVGNPGIVDDAQTPQLAAVHQDSDFWTNAFPALQDPPRPPGITDFGVPLPMQDLDLPPPTIVRTDLTSNQRVFADDLVSRIYTNDNECSSALGVSMANSLVYPAAIGDSLTQMATTLRYPQSETNLQLLWRDTQASIQATYDGACRGYEDVEETICIFSTPRVSISNAVFVPSQAGLNSTYEQVVGDFVFEIDFEAKDAGSLVNEWVNASTNGLIESIVDDGPLSPLVLLAINTIYLKAFWAIPFSVSNTNEDTFYTSVARSEALASKTHFMHQVERFDYSHADVPDYQLLGLPFNDDGLSVYFALPMSSDVPMMTSEDLFAAIPRLNLTRVAIALPKFQFESEYDEILMESLKAMGMQAPFLGDLCIQIGSCDVSISRVAQKTFIDVNEVGVEAAAVTSMSGITSMQEDSPVLFQADHPFQFFIYDETQQVVIFEGQVGDPGIVDGAATPQLTASHEDADFWSLFGVDPSLPVPPEVLEQPSFSSTDLISNHRVFADDLVPRIYTKDNECSSALGISMAHSLVYPSLIDNSLTQMAATFGYPLSETNLQLLWNDTQNSIQGAYNGTCMWYSEEDEAVCEANAPIVNIGNAVFVPSQAGLNSTYEQVVGGYVLEIDFDAEDAGSLVNAWVNTTTNGLIESIVDDGPLSSLVLLAVNTIYFKGSWMNPFSVSATNEDTFYTSMSRSEALANMTHFMHQVDFFDYSDTANPEYQLLKQSFNNKGLSMFFALPIGDDTSMMTSEDLFAAIPRLNVTRVAVALPKFQFKSEYEEILMDSLQAMGMVAPFSGGLCIQDGYCDAYISLVIQKTFIDVNEDGVEAAAASVIGASRSKPTDTPVLFRADHPFQFFIYDENEQVVLFEGRVGNPGIVDGASTPQLMARHEDADFWATNFGVDLNGSSTSEGPGTSVSVRSDLKANQRVFADDLVVLIYEKDNECSSTLGISMAHSLVYPAAIDQSLIDMMTTLRYPSSETNLQLLWNETQNRIQDTYNGECNLYEDLETTICASSAPLVQIGNAVFVPIQAGLNSTYEQVVGDFVFEIDFVAEDAGSLVNAWVNASSNGLIESIVDEGPLSPLVLLAINTIYLKAAWAIPFTISFTNEDTFYTSAARSQAVASKTHFMHKVDYFDYSHDSVPDYQLLRQPFSEKGLSMYFALPTSSDVPMMTSEVMFAALPQLNQTRVAIALPKFQFESEYEEILMDSLKAMGMQAPFLGGLCIQSGACDTAISSVVQKTFIDVNEEGVEAAAVTLVSGTTSMPMDPPMPMDTPILFLADHPFQFFIYDEDEQVIIFEGRVGDPGIVNGAATPQLTATHADTDFWVNNFGVDPFIPSSSPPEVLEQPSTDPPATTPPGEETSSEDKPADSTNTTDGKANTPDAGETASSAAVDNNNIFQTSPLALLVASFIGGYWWLV